MTRMEIVSSSENDAPISPSDSIIQRLSQMGVPSKYLDLMQPGLVAFVTENPSMLSEIISTILSINEDVFWVQVISRDDSDIESRTVSKGMFVESLLWLQWLMFRDEPQSALRKLAEKEVGQRAVCGAVWGQNDLAYRCRTCEHDPTCAICVPCFQNGNHKGHDYSIIYTSGGCCDCGDITAWKPEGFCSKHVGTEQIKSLSQEDMDSIGPVLLALLLHWKESLLSVEDNARQLTTKTDQTDIQGKVSNVFSFVIVNMLLDFCRCSESLLCFVSCKICQSAGLLDLLVKAEWFLSEIVVKKLHELLLKSLAEPTFKYEFAKLFIPYYPHVIEQAVKKINDSVINTYPLLNTFSVQVFTVPTLTPRLVREENLMGVLLECLGKLFYSCVGTDGHLQVDKWYRLHTVSIRLVEDIRLSLNHAEVQRYITNEHPDIFRMWLRLMGLVQGMDPQKRVTGVHTEEENVHLFAPFALCRYLGKVHNLLIEGAFSANEFNRSNNLFPDNPGKECFEQDDEQRHAKMGRLSWVIPSRVTWLISECLQVIENCLESETKALLEDSSHLGFNFLGISRKLFKRRSNKCSIADYRRSLSLSPQAIAEHNVDATVESSDLLSLTCWPEIAYDVGSQEITFHIPLHNFLSLLLHRALKTCCNDIGASESSCSVSSLSSAGHNFFSQALGKYHPCGFSAFLMEAPLRLRVFCAQVHAGMWRRNGDAGPLMTEWYHAVRRFETSVEADLFLLQCCAALAPPESFVTRIIERFGLSDYCLLNLAQFNEYEPVLMREMLILIIQIIKERGFCGMSAREVLQREMVHKLALGDATHSQLLKALPHDLAKSKQVQNILDTVAVYTEPSCMKEGKYSLRNSHWKELDLYHPRWNSRDLQVAEERYLQVCRVSPLDAQLPRWTEVFGPLSTISWIATCRPILQIVQAVLFYAVFTRKPSACRAPDRVLLPALHLLALALDICEKHMNVHANKYDGSINQHSEVTYPAESKIPVLEFASEPICMGLHKDSDIGKNESLISLLVSLMRKHKNESSYADSRVSNVTSLVEGILKRFAHLSGDYLNEVKTLAPDVIFQMPEFSCSSSVRSIMQSSDIDKSRKAKSREHQAAILEKMRAEQFKFAASLKFDEKDDLAAPLSTEEKVQAPICCLCHDTRSKSPLSFVALLQKSRLLSFINRNCPTWEETDKMDMDFGDGPINIAIDTPISSNLSHDLQPTEFYIASNLPPNQLPHDSYIQPRYLSNAERNTLTSVEMMERNIYQSVVENMVNWKFQCEAVDGPIPVVSVESKGLRNDSNREMCDSGRNFAYLLMEMSKNHASTGSPRSHGDASFTSTIPALSDCDGVHISSCGHAVHQECHDWYLSSLKQRYPRRLALEGGRTVDPDMGEFLCPLCRRFANSILPASSNILNSHDTWKEKNLPISFTPNVCSIPSDSDSNCSRVAHALSLLQGVGQEIKHGNYSLENCLRAFPTERNGTIKPALQQILQKLFEMYFPRENSISGHSRLYDSLMLWDIFKYSLISMEIAARRRTNTCSETSNSCIEALNKEFCSSNGFILAELLQLAHAVRKFSKSHLLLKFGGIQLFINSICFGGTGQDNILNNDWKQDPMLSVLQQVEGEVFPGIQFWKFMADPVLAHDPFMSLMWILFALPLPFMLSTESFLSFVHLFYIVCVVQALITCVKQHKFDKASISNCGLYHICKTVGESSLAGQYFVANQFDDSCTINEMIRKFTFPYLRRCALLSMLLKSLSSDELTQGIERIGSNSTDNIQTDISGVTELENMFHISSLDIVFNSQIVQFFASKWCEHFLRVYEAYEPRTVLYSTTAVAFRLMQLPLLYQDLLERYIKRKCSYCGNIPAEPALCLLCGRLCSPSWRHCCRRSRCRSHAAECGAGIGIFLLVKRTTILLQRSRREALWPSLYLDAFGEEDHDMARGRPLYLSHERYLVLMDLVSSHGLDHNSEVFRRTNSNYILD